MYIQLSATKWSLPQYYSGTNGCPHEHKGINTTT